jgi:hypothetical protein
LDEEDFTTIWMKRGHLEFQEGWLDLHKIMENEIYEK